MSNRRLARGGPEVARERRRGVPLELAARFDPCWSDAEQSAALVAAHGLEPRVLGHSWSTAPAWARFDAFRLAYCQTNGLMHAEWPGLIAPRRARDAGIDTSGSSRFRLRRQDIEE